MPKYTVTLTYTFEFNTDNYYDVDDGIANFDPDDEDSVLEYLEESITLDVLGDMTSPDITIQPKKD